MNVPELRSPVVQKLPGAELAQVISNGQGGMPFCKGSLSEDQIHAPSDAHTFAASKKVVSDCRSLLPGRRASAATIAFRGIPPERQVLYE